MFIVFEGVDGTGKSTQLKKCQDWIETLDRQVLVCRDPGSTELGLKLRELLLNRSELQIDSTAEMFMFMAARAQMVHESILPALERNEIVLCDRFLMSTVVYQGHAGQLDPRQIWRIGETAIQNRHPDLTLIFDAPLQVAMKRLGSERDRMESRGEEYFANVRRGFLAEAACDEPAENCRGKMMVIDANGDAADIHVQVRSAIESTLEIGATNE